MLESINYILFPPIIYIFNKYLQLKQINSDTFFHIITLLHGIHRENGKIVADLLSDIV